MNFFAFFQSERDHKPQNSGCGDTAQSFHTAWVTFRRRASRPAATGAPQKPVAKKCGQDGRRSCGQPRNRAVADIVTARDVARSVARIAALDRLSLLVRRELRLAAELDAVGHRARPSLVRARISSRSNSARPPSTIVIERPCGVVSAHVSPSDRKPAPGRRSPRGCSRGRASIAPSDRGA
jgi:hypothetical protein